MAHQLKLASSVFARKLNKMIKNFVSCSNIPQSSYAENDRSGLIVCIFTQASEVGALDALTLRMRVVRIAEEFNIECRLKNVCTHYFIAKQWHQEVFRSLPFQSVYSLYSGVGK